MVPDPGPWIALAIGVCLVVVGLIVAALGIGWWGKKRAKRDGKLCPDCGAWGAPADILIHRIQEHYTTKSGN